MTAPGSPYLNEGTLLAGRYLVGRELGRGGFSVVYQATDQSVRGAVAVKLLVPPPAGAALARERMRREVQAVRGLSHSNIVQVYDFAEDGPWSFVVMELVTGPDLAERVRRRGPLTPGETVQLGREVAQGLATAHRKGVIHRDVKPQNILLDADGHARLTDFGSAKLEGVTGVTRTGGLVGTLDYMAPELLAGRRGDGRADLYALGLTLHFALTGRLPERSSAHAPVSASAEGHRPSRILGSARVPSWLDDLVAQATMAAPEGRFPSALAMDEALASGGAGRASRQALMEAADRCALCREIDPFGLGLCVRCGGTSPSAAECAIVVRPQGTRSERESVRMAVHQLLNGRASTEAADAAAAGERALLRIPAASESTVLEHLAGHGVPAQAVAQERLWAELPLRFYALVTAIAGVGIAAGAVVPLVGWASPAVAGVWWVLAFREIRRPALASVGLATKLPPEVEREIVSALTELPAGTARDLLADVVRSGQRIAQTLSTSGELDRAGEIGRVLGGASRAARQIAGLEESLSGLESRPEWNSDPRLIGAADALERGRDRLVQELLEVLTSLGRSQGRMALAGTTTGPGGDQLSVLAAELEQSVLLRAEARREVEALLAP
ncbi:MAG TPA: serine/threonine-protein kinase [Gemmatimonadales bacterium]|nr:serine/threonine-protein kinase [Gemmatimonadales bacterium]